MFINKVIIPTTELSDPPSYNMLKKLTMNACQEKRAVIADKIHVYLLKQGANISKIIFFSKFHVYQLTAGRDGRKPDLIPLPVPLVL